MNVKKADRMFVRPDFQNSLTTVSKIQLPTKEGGNIQIEKTSNGYIIRGVPDKDNNREEYFCQATADVEYLYIALLPVEYLSASAGTATA